MKFEGENILEFADIFPDNQSRLAYLSEQKWPNKFKSKKCGDYKYTVTYQLKSCLKSTYLWVCEARIEKYLNEFSFQIYRLIHKQTIFHNLIIRMAKAHPLTYQMIKINT